MKKNIQIQYTDDFKIKVLEKITSGEMSPRAAGQQFGLGKGSTIYNWMRKFGIESPNIIIRDHDMKKQKSDLLKQEKQQKPEDELENLKADYAKLIKELEYERLKTEALTTMIEIAEKRFNIPIKKKSGEQPLKP